jgi:hypothetical protein
MVLNFKIHEINRGIHKLIQIFTLIKKIKKNYDFFPKTKSKYEQKRESHGIATQQGRRPFFYLC